MAATEWDKETFEAHRSLLFSIAYRMLGSASEAEDIVQDAWLRARQHEHADVRSSRAYLTTIFTRLCIDQLRSAELVSDGGGKAVAATHPVLGADRITRFVLGYASKLHWSASDFTPVTINGTPGLLMRHPLAGAGAYSFDIADGRFRAIYIVRNPDKLRGFLERTH